MEEKLIHRAALKYRKWMIEKSRAHQEEGAKAILHRVHVIARKSEEIKRWVNRFYRGSTPRFQINSLEKKTRHKTNEGIANKNVYKDIALTMVPALESDMRQNLSTMASLLKINAEKNPITPLSMKEAIEEIRIISNAWKDVAYRDGVISISIADVVLEDENEEVELGPFKISLNLEHPLGGPSISPMPSDIESNRGYRHPHVSGSHLCTGDGGILMKEALCQGRLEDYFRIVEAILRTYNEVSPYQPLSNWYNPDHEGEFCCGVCEEWYDNDDSLYCGSCELTCCSECGSGGGCCLDCGDWRCDECSTYCKQCEETICNGCAKSCRGCSQASCSGCLQECTICNHDYCGQCVQSCSYCGDRTCEDCTTTCGCCEDNCCSNCVIETCKECKKDICKGCVAECGECNNDLCNNCADNVCVHCGIQMCESCVNEHNCLLEGVTST